MGDLMSWSRYKLIMEKFNFIKGNSPLLISSPHSGSFIPEDIAKNMTSLGRASTDSDWHVDELYGFSIEMGASLLSATHSRYVIDLNRPHDDQNLYPGQDTTSLAPVDSFTKESLYLSTNPTEAEVELRVQKYWQPYHDKIASTLAEIKKEFGYALLWDAHSIRSEVPRFFQGKLPDMNLGTANGSSCANELAQVLLDDARGQTDFSYDLNGRFKGGHITRHYGNPKQNIHVVQLEQSQLTYMNEDSPFNLMDEKVAGCTPLLKKFIETMIGFKPDLNF